MAQGKFSAAPSKEFFIEMLTKDIPLERAIIDLIDNSVDGAKNHLAKNNKDYREVGYKDYKIEIYFNTREFVIKDNCGGFSKKIADEYAFKLGKPDEYKSSEKAKGMVGRFGIGMKRALFKIGTYFIVESKSNGDHFIVEENVVDWKDDREKWEFNFRDVDGDSNDKLHKAVLDKNGTFVKVTNLNEAVKQDFSLKSFHKKIISEIERTLNYSLKRDLTIEVNRVRLESDPIQLLVSDDLRPYYFEENINGVNVKVFAGIAEPNPNLAGWYIYCNDRLMVDRDRSNLTGWEGGKKFYDDSGVQKFHNKVAMFRGLVFFSSDDSSALPMTTTKWGIDVNSTIYKSTRNKMIHAMKVVLGDLNRLNNAEERQQIVQNSTSMDIVEYQKQSDVLSEDFKFPEVKKNKFGDGKSGVSYRVDTQLLNKVKKHLNVSTNGKAGEETFNYYVHMKELNHE